MEKRLTRSISDKMIAGVAAGLGNYLGIDSTVARLLFVLATFFHGSGLLVYIILWIAMPVESQDEYLRNQGSSPQPPPQNPEGSSVKTGDSGGSRSAGIIGWILVGLGVFFLMDEFMYPWFHDLFYWINIRRVWPIIFVVVGILIISSANKKQASGEKNPHPGKEPDLPRGPEPPVADNPVDPVNPASQPPPPSTQPPSSAGPPASASPPSTPPSSTPLPPTPGMPRPHDPGPSRGQEPPSTDKPDDPGSTNSKQ